MWVILPTVVLFATVAVQSAIGSTTGQPWPASAAGYANFSQVNPTVSTKLENSNNAPIVQSAPTPSPTINLDLSNPSTNLTEALMKALAPTVANVHITSKQQTISTTLNITPPPNANMDFVKDLQTAVGVALSKLVPSAGSSLRIAITKSSSGVVVNVKAYLDIIIPAAVKKVPALPPSNVPEIDLQKSSSGLLQSLQSILIKELALAGYNPESKSVQKFSLSFSILPPEGATKDFVRLYILGPLQSVLKFIVPGAALTSVSVNTQESNNKILRQIVNFQIQITPPPEFQLNENVVEIPEIDLGTAGNNVVSTVITTLQNEIRKTVAVKPTKAETLSIPFKITPPAGATQQQIQELYIIPLSQVLSKLDPTGKILKISQKTLPNGDIIIIIYMNIPANSTSITSSGQIQPVVVTVSPQSTTVSQLVTETQTTKAQTPVSINNRNSFPEGEEDEIPEESTESTGSETSNPSSNQNVPPNAIKTSVVDLTTPTASVNSIKKILEQELSPLTNPKNDAQPKVLAIPFRMKPPAGATLKQIEENVVVPLGKLLTTLEPTGNVLSTQTEPLPNGDVESVVYFNIPSVDGSNTYKVISNELESSKTSTAVPAINTATPVITKTTSKPQTQTPNVELPENNVETSPIDLSHPNFDQLKNGIEKRLKDAIKSNPSKNGEPQTIDFSFVVPKDQASRIPVMAQAIATLLKGLVPSGKAAPNIAPKVLPNGNVQFDINYEIPTTPGNKPAEKLVDDLSKPSELPKLPKAIVEEKPSQITNEVEPKNAVITPPIIVNQTKLENLPADIKQRIGEARKNSNGQPQVIGVPFVLSDNQKPSFIFTQALKMALKNVEPSGNIVKVGEPKALPNGDTELILYDEFPAITQKNNPEKAVEEKTKPTLKPVVPKITPKTEQPRPTTVIPPPKNAVMVQPIDLSQIKQEDIPNEIRKRINTLLPKSNGQPEVVGLPIILPFKPNAFSLIALKTALKAFIPGKLLQVSEPKVLPNGNTELIFYDEIPSVGKQQIVKDIEEATKPSAELIIPKFNPETVKPNKVVTAPETKPLQPQNEVPPPKNAVLVAPIDVRQTKLEDIPKEIQQRVDEIKDTTNGKPQVVGFPFILPFEKPSFIITESLKTMFKTLLPGNVVQVTEPKSLPDGTSEFIIYDELPSLGNQQTSKDNEESIKPSSELILPKFNPETELPEKKNEIKPNKVVTVPEAKQPQTQNEVPPPKNAVIVNPIDVRKTKIEDLPKEIQQRVDKIKNISNGKPQVVGFPFILPFEKPNYFTIQSFKTMLQTVLPGSIVQVSEPKSLPDGTSELIIYDELPAVTNNRNAAKDIKDDEIYNDSIVFPPVPTTSSKVLPPKTKEEELPVAAVEDVNLDEPGASVEGEAAKALTNAINTIVSSKTITNLNEPIKIKFDVYAPLKNSKSQNEKLINDVSSVLSILEPSAKIVTAKTKNNPQNNEPDGIIEIVIPSIVSSNTAQNLKNALKLPTIDINVPQTDLVVNIKNLLAQGLKGLGQLNPDGSQLFDLSFRLNPFDTKGSVDKVLTALKAVDPKGEIVSYKIRSGADGLDYLDVVYLIPKLEDSIIYEIVKPQEPQVIYESFVNIDTRNPTNNLLENVIKEVGASEDEVQGATKGQLVNLPLDFRFTNSKGLSDSRVSQIISQTLPSIEGYISQILPDGKIQSVDTEALPDSDDVVLKIVVRTPYEPDNDIVIEEVRPQVRTVVTTPKPKSKGLFGLFGL